MIKFMNSLRNARRGFRLAVAEEPNLRIHFVVASIVIVLGLLLDVARIEWFALIIVISIVICLEMVNSIFERAIDMIKPSVNQYVKDMKDMMAATVLIAACGAVIVGFLIFVPKLAALFSY